MCRVLWEYKDKTGTAPAHRNSLSEREREDVYTLSCDRRHGMQYRKILVTLLWKFRRRWNKDGHPAKLHERVDICMGL